MNTWKQVAKKYRKAYLFLVDDYEVLLKEVNGMTPASSLRSETKACAEGLRLSDEYEKLQNTFQKFKRFHMLIFMTQAWRIWQAHRDGCEECGGHDES